MSTRRYCKNPVIRPEDVKPSRPDFEVTCVFNAGVARVGDEVVLLLRVAERPVSLNSRIRLSPYLDISTGSILVREFDISDSECDFSDSRVIKSTRGIYLTSISHLRVARSTDGVNFVTGEHPALFPDSIYDIYGIEDPRISCIEGRYYITYSAISDVGITACLASTNDFVTFQKHGVIFHPDNKDVAIFPGKLDGRYYALHRPNSSFFRRNEIWLADSPDLSSWGNHRYLMGQREGYWDDGRIGGGAVPFRIDQGWLEIYHGASRKDRYCLGAVLLDGDRPWKILARSEKPIMEPEASYETDGFFGNVVFSCGLLFEENRIKLYYGAADTYTAYAEIPFADVMNSLV